MVNNRLDPKKTIVSILVLSIVAGIGYSIFRQTTQVVTPQIAQVSDAGSVSLDASPPPTFLYLNQSFTLDINAHPSTDKITAVQLDLSYDPASVEITSVTPTDYLPVVLEAPTIVSGHATLVVGAPVNSGGRDTWGTVVKLNVKTKKLGPQIINFGDGCLVAGLNSSGERSYISSNILKSVTPIQLGVYNVGDINFSKTIDLFDYNLFVKDWGVTTPTPANLDGKNGVDLYDYNLFVANYGLKSP
jgi:hypothetical protein